MENPIIELLNNRICYSRKINKINLSVFLEKIIEIISYTNDMISQKNICVIFNDYLDYILQDCEIRYDLTDDEIMDITSELSKLSTIFFSVDMEKYNKVCFILNELRKNFPLKDYHINQENKMENYPE
jgi:hypothetical protein